MHFVEKDPSQKREDFTKKLIENFEEIEVNNRDNYFSSCPLKLDGKVLENQGRVFLKS